MKRVHIVHGWAEGPWQSEDFVRALKAKGFGVTDNASEADILVAHSAGCYFIPDDMKAGVIMLIGLPFWPGKRLPRSLFEKLKLEAQQHQKRRDIGWFISKLAYNTWYIVTKPQSSWRFFKNHRNLKLPMASPSQKVILVRNKNDRFCTPRVMELLGKARGYEFVELPGIHDDCWMAPKPYVDLLLKEYN